jgi:ribosomal subunit interface protein
MQIDIKGHETELSKEVKTYAKKKMEKLGGYGVNILGIELTLEEDHNKKESTAGQAKVLVKIAGRDISAKGEGKHLFSAIDEVERKAKRELVESKKRSGQKSKLAKSKEIVRSIFRQG